MTDVCVYVANHKDAAPLENDPYRLLRVGSKREEAASSDNADIAFDASGESIAYKNFSYCELTGWYWIWKNTAHDITGLMHYRRYLMSPDADRPLNAEEIEQALEEFDCLVAKPRQLGCSAEEHYCYCHPSTDLLALRQSMAHQPRKYQEAFKEAMEADAIIPYNMMIAKRDVIDAYCAWLFSVLAECEEHIDLYSGRDEYQLRVFGFLAERLLAVWLRANEMKCMYCDVQMNGLRVKDEETVMEGYEFDYASGIEGLRKEQIFDREYYLAANEDIADACGEGDQALGHFFNYGIKEGRSPSRTYSLQEYKDLRPELRSNEEMSDLRFFDALMQEAEQGSVLLPRHIVLGRTKVGKKDYAPVYDWLYYTTHYDDVPDDYDHTEKALQHFIEVGIPEGRQGSKGFSLAAYKERHPWLAKVLNGRNGAYYRLYALGEGRKKHPIKWGYAE